MNKYALTAIAGAAAGITLAGCLGFALAGSNQPEEPKVDTPAVEIELPPCPTEDSEGCYWDAKTMGNKQGTDVVTLPEEYPTEGMPEDFDPETDSTPPVEGEYEGQWDEDPGEGYLLCGKDAAPALDYNEVWGWWAYCEPAMVNEDGSLWQG